MKPVKHLPKELKPFQWKKGVSGNPKGRPPGPTLKEFAKNYLMSLPESEKLAYLASLPAEIVWKMAEGNPATTTDITTKGDKIDFTIVSYANDTDSPPVQA